LPFNYYLSLFSSSLRTPLDLALAGQPLALYCTFSLDRSKPVTVGLPWFIPAPPSLLEFTGWLDFTAVALGYEMVRVALWRLVVLMWLGCPGDPIGRRGCVDFFCWDRVTGLPEWDLMLAIMLFSAVFGGWLWEVDLLCSTLVGWFYLKIVVCQSDARGFLCVARVVLSYMYWTVYLRIRSKK